ncbi:MAG: hypothetical protein HYR85_08845 [Planctomycetes bacterium]|nr:hypothetical protein [Planctomycetota bacterium]MBI3847250.1 hypothetical protein [Planctomycetota bacterium]
MRHAFGISVVGFSLCAATALAWDGEGHRIVTTLALDALPKEAPAWMRDPAFVSRVAWESNEPDRWRGTSIVPMAHENSPDHYIDVEYLEPLGLSLETLPPFRYEYLKAMVLAKQKPNDRMMPYDPAKDADKSREWPGFLPYSILEHYAKLSASFQTLRLLEKVGDRVKPEEMAMAHANVEVEMGLLSHFVGDAAQPLHTSKHFNGWAGANPNGYTTSRKFHEMIDGGVLAFHQLNVDSLRGKVELPQRAIADPKAPWNDVIDEIRRSLGEVEPLYKLEKDGGLNEAAGKKLIVARLADGASMLAALYWGAWTSSAPTDEQVHDYLVRHYGAAEVGGAKR